MAATAERVATAVRESGARAFMLGERPNGGMRGRVLKRREGEPGPDCPVAEKTVEVVGRVEVGRKRRGAALILVKVGQDGLDGGMGLGWSGYQRAVGNWIVN